MPVDDIVVPVGDIVAPVGDIVAPVGDAALRAVAAAAASAMDPTLIRDTADGETADGEKFGPLGEALETADELARTSVCIPVSSTPRPVSNVVSCPLPPFRNRPTPTNADERTGLPTGESSSCTPKVSYAPRWFVPVAVL